MTVTRLRRGRTKRSKSDTRVGLFGLLGQGNLGNDGSLESVLAFLRAQCPKAALSCFCSGPDRVTARYGVPATSMYWSRSCHGPTVKALASKVFGKCVTAIRTARWVRGRDFVIVPGMGVLEETLPVVPWRFPYGLFLVCLSGRVLRTRIALVGVGADVIDGHINRWLLTHAARLAHYRSYRDVLSMNAMRSMGVDTSGDMIYPDLAFALPVPKAKSAAKGAVGVGVLAYYGGSGDRDRASEIHHAYVDTVQRFVRWLVERGRQVRLFVGDSADETVVTEVLADVWAWRPGLDPASVVAEPVSDLDELMRQMESVETVVASRYHNVLCALKLAKPTLSISYAAKNDVLMAAMGLGEFCQSARFPDLDRLVDQFTELEARRESLVETMTAQNEEYRRQLQRQFAALAAAFPDDAEPTSDLPPQTPVPWRV